MEEVSDQDILDQHVSRVWSDLTPIRSPGQNTPGQNTGKRRPGQEPCTLFGPCTSRTFCLLNYYNKISLCPNILGSQSSMRHSKTMPDGTKKLNHKWPSVNTDSGISLLSSDTLSKYKESRPFSRSELSSAASTSPTLEESKKKLDEDMRKYVHQFFYM